MPLDEIVGLYVRATPGSTERELGHWLLRDGLAWSQQRAARMVAEGLPEAVRRGLAMPGVLSSGAVTYWPPDWGSVGAQARMSIGGRGS